MKYARNVVFASTAAQWQEHQDENSFSSNSTDYVSGNAYQSMVQMGPCVIGNVMDKYAGEQDGWWHEMLHEIVHGRPSGMRTFLRIVYMRIGGLGLRVANHKIRHRRVDGNRIDRFLRRILVLLCLQLFSASPHSLHLGPQRVTLIPVHAVIS